MGMHSNHNCVEYGEVLPAMLCHAIMKCVRFATVRIMCSIAAAEMLVLDAIMRRCVSCHSQNHVQHL